MGSALNPPKTMSGVVEVTWTAEVSTTSNASGGAGASFIFTHVAQRGPMGAATSFPLCFTLSGGLSTQEDGVTLPVPVMASLAWSGLGATPFSANVVLSSATVAISGTLTVECDLELATEGRTRGRALYWRPVPGSTYNVSHVCSEAALDFTRTGSIAGGADYDWAQGGALNAFVRASGAPAPFASCLVGATIDGYSVSCPQVAGSSTGPAGTGSWDNAAGCYAEVTSDSGGAIVCDTASYAPRSVHIRGKVFDVDQASAAGRVWIRRTHHTDTTGQIVSAPRPLTLENTGLSETAYGETQYHVVSRGGGLGVPGQTNTGTRSWMQPYFCSLSLEARDGLGRVKEMLQKLRPYPGAVTVTLADTLTFAQGTPGSSQMFFPGGANPVAYAYARIKVKSTGASLPFTVTIGGMPSFGDPAGHYGDLWERDRSGVALVTSPTPGTSTYHIIDVCGPWANFRILPGTSTPVALAPPAVDPAGPYLGARPLNNVLTVNEGTPATTEIEEVVMLREEPAALFAYPTSGSDMRAFVDGALSEIPTTPVAADCGWTVVRTSYPGEVPGPGSVGGGDGVTYEDGLWVDWISQGFDLGETLNVSRQSYDTRLSDWPANCGDAWDLEDPGAVWAGNLIMAASAVFRTVCLGAVWDSNMVRQSGALVRVTQISNGLVVGDVVSVGWGLYQTDLPYIPTGIAGASPSGLEPCLYELPGVGSETFTAIEPWRVIFCGFSGYVSPPSTGAVWISSLMHPELGHFTRVRTKAQEIVCQRTGGGVPGEQLLLAPVVVAALPSTESPGPLSLGRWQQEQLEVLFATEAAGGWRIYRATSDDDGDTWAARTLVWPTGGGYLANNPFPKIARATGDGIGGAIYYWFEKTGVDGGGNDKGNLLGVYVAPGSSFSAASAITFKDETGTALVVLHGDTHMVQSHGNQSVWVLSCIQEGDSDVSEWHCANETLLQFKKVV